MKKIREFSEAQSELTKLMRDPDSLKFVELTNCVYSYGPKSPEHTVVTRADKKWHIGFGNGLYTIIDGDGRVFVAFADVISSKQVSELIDDADLKRDNGIAVGT